MKAHLRNLAAPLLRRRPDFLIIGAQKAGTTSLHRYLASHPSLEPCTGPKELHYFDLRHHWGPGWYLSHFPARYRSKGCLSYEATPDYLCHAIVPGRIRSDLGRIKLIAVLREPAARAYSAWRMWHSFADKPEKSAKADPRSFEAAIDDELASPERAAAGHYHYVAMGHYLDQLTAYWEHFEREDILVLDYDEMVRDLQSFLDRICRFLDVAPFEEPITRELATTRHWVGPNWPVTPGIDAAMARLRDHYAPRNARLFETLGRRFDW